MKNSICHFYTWSRSQNPKPEPEPEAGARTFSRSRLKMDSLFRVMFKNELYIGMYGTVYVPVLYVSRFRYGI